MNNVQIDILFNIDHQIGANKQLYLQFNTIFNAFKATQTESAILEALNEMVNDGYLETKEKSYHITTRGFIFLEAYIITDDLRQIMEDNIKTTFIYQWIGIGIAFFVILLLALLK